MRFQRVARKRRVAQHKNPQSQARPANPAPAAMNPLLQLHKTIGNRAVGRIIQAKLTLGQPNDKYEQEADRVAEQVLQMPAVDPSGNPQGIPGTAGPNQVQVSRIQRQPAEEEEPVQMQAEAEEEEPLQMKAEAKAEAEEEEPLQRQAEAEEEEPVQMKAEAEEEEPVQMKAEAEEEEPVQMKAEEEEPLQTKAGSGSAKIVNRTSQIVNRKSKIEKPLQAKVASGSRLETRNSKLETRLQTKAGSGGAPAVTPRVQTSINSLRGGGNPLSPAVRAFFEPRFGADFSKVRVHTGSRAAETSLAVNAKAFTVGQDMVFGPGEYSPGTSEGKKLLAHELTHVVQQNRLNSPSRNSIQRRLFVSGGNEADVIEYLNLVGTAAGLRLNWNFRNPRVRIAGDRPGAPPSPNARRMLQQVINDPRQHAELHIGTHQPRVGVGAFPAPPSTIQNIDMDDIRNLNASLPNQGTAKAFHEMLENYNSHAAAAPGFGPSHAVGLESESNVLEDLGIVGRRLGGGLAPVVIPAPAGQPVGPNIIYQRSRQVFTHYFLDIIFRVTTGAPGGPGADFEIVSATRVPKVQVSQRTIDRFASGSNAIPPAGNVLLATTLADLNANPGSTLELEGFTDSAGSLAVNRRVGRQRAEAVRAWFVAQGINANRIAIVGRGETNFVAANNTAAGRAQNRRVVMTVHR